MSKGLDALKKIKLNRQFSLEMFEKELAIIEKELVALEIIKEKNVNCSHLVCETLDYYNSTWDFDGGEKYQLTKKEYNLLKEILK